jgi:hypothetical protein
LATLVMVSAGESHRTRRPVWYEAVMWVAMGAAGREEFVAGVHVGVLSAAMGTAGQTLAVPVWYSYQPGGLVTVLTGRRSRKAAAIRAAGRFGLCAQDARPTVMSASRGRSWPRRNSIPAERLAMARRYLGAAGGHRYVAGNPGPRAGERGVPDAPGALAEPGSGQGTSQTVALAPGIIRCTVIAHMRRYQRRDSAQQCGRPAR